MDPARDDPARDDPAGDDSCRLHPLLAVRWSPTSFDAGHEVDEATVETLLEAARWAPSAGNSQPWAFVAGRRGDATHVRLVPHLTGSSAAWAPTASILVANLVHRFVEDTDWDYSEFAMYDLGQAVAHMTVQAQSMGLQARQFRAFRREALAAEFAVPAHWQVATMTAFGRVPDEVATFPGDAARPASRRRRPVAELRWRGQ
jgi:nitroreductase